MCPCPSQTEPSGPLQTNPVPSHPGWTCRPWRECMHPIWLLLMESFPLRAAFGMLFSTDSLLQKKRPASHLYHKVSQSQHSRGTGLLSCDTFWVQQQHDTATFATKLPGCRAHVAGPPRRTTPCAERSNGTQPMGPAVFLAPPAISLSCPVASNPLVS